MQILHAWQSISTSSWRAGVASSFAEYAPKSTVLNRFIVLLTNPAGTSETAARSFVAGAALGPSKLSAAGVCNTGTDFWLVTARIRVRLPSLCVTDAGSSKASCSGVAGTSGCLNILIKCH